MNRTIGPVTTAAGGGVAASGVLCWIISLFGTTVPSDVQTYIGILFVLIAGYVVKPSSTGTGSHVA